MIEVKNITKKYGDKFAIKDISFSIKKGEIVGLLGPNGAGKSTIMKIINSFISPDAGKINVGSYDIAYNSVDTKKLIGYLPESNPLYQEMYVLEYLEYIVDIYNISKKDIYKTIKKVGLDKEVNKKIHQLSKGYKQRVGLAAAIIHNPDYLILDEPITGLDPNQIIDIRNLIKEFGKEKTVILSTHIMQEVEAMCDRVLIINKGKLIKDSYIKDLNVDKTNTCKVVFKNEVALDSLMNTTNIELVNKINTTTFLFKKHGDDILSKLVYFSTKNNNPIVEFKVSEKSVGDIFTALTK